MEFRSVEIGKKFIDPGLTSQPGEYRVHRVTALHADHFEAEHIASNTMRRFPRTLEAISKLHEVGPAPMVVAVLDGLVGEKVRINLADGGRLHGMVTAIRYHEVAIDGTVCRSVKEVEIDRSGATSYKWTEITSIVAVRRPT